LISKIVSDNSTLILKTRCARWPLFERANNTL
jgi:hypothetical protein